jgi:hypothetical protein
LVAHWKLDEGTGDVFADSAGGYDGFLPDAVEVEWINDGPPGIQEWSVEFIGDFTDSYIETPFYGIGGADPRTIALWFKADPQVNHTAVVAWGSHDNYRKWHFRIDRDTSTLRTEFAGGQNYATSDVTDGQWHFAASIFPDGGVWGTDIMHFLDGDWDPQSGGNSDFEIDTAIDPNENAYPVHIGFAAGHAGRFFVGQIADVRIYDEALDEDALRAIMEGGDLATQLQPGDADMDLDFDQLDLVKVQIAAKYLSGQTATWGEGDWDGAPGGEPGNPPQGNGFFDQIDIVAALGAGKYLTGPYGATPPGNQTGHRRLTGGADISGADFVYVPEPSSIILLVLGILFGGRRRAWAT